ncbi:MAG: OmpA family protein [Flavobacteriales bacterium]|nr:OmpA family protein [Flavobacteriales bacterium]
MYCSAKSIFHFLILAIVLSSCVAEKRYKEEVAARAMAEEERARLKAENIDLKAIETDLNDKVAKYETQLKQLKEDTTSLAAELKKAKAENKKINANYNDLLEQMGKLREGNAADVKKLTRELQDARNDILAREDELRELELTLMKKEGNLDNIRQELDRSRQELEDKRVQLMARGQRINELESVLARKDSAVTALKNKITNALLGFQDQGLTVEQKNGKVYVSLEEQLLFKSGSWVVDAKGKEALMKLGKVLQTQPDVGILVEGHTDNVPYGGNGNVTDNWDLSVKRATSIVKILTENSEIDPQQLTAAGRSEYMPLDPADTKEARAKNRRTEIIITPKLNELFQILEQN